MPEGPEVRSIANCLRKEVKDFLITKISFTTKKKKHKLEGLERFTRIVDIRSHGKKLIFELRTPDDRKAYLFNGVLMDGKWSFKPNKHTQVSLKCTKLVNNKVIYKELHYGGYYRYGEILFLKEKEFEKVMKKLGLDLLSLELDEEIYDYYVKVARRYFNNKQVCTFLLDQRFIAGIGNYLKAEILYECKIHPAELVCKLTDEELVSLLTTSHRIINESYRKNGLTISLYKTPHGKLGTYECKVYGKKHDEFGNEVKRDEFADRRKTHWVAEVQVLKQ
jgi:Formamidopyrimidine-DNA glycosylase